MTSGAATATPSAADSLGDLLKRVKPLHNSLQAVFAGSICNRPAALLACFLAGLVRIIVRRVAAASASSCSRAAG